MPHNGLGKGRVTGHFPHRPERSIAVFVLAAVLFFQPFLGIFDRGSAATVGGVPLLFAYIFFGWAIVIALTAIIMERRSVKGGPESPDAPAELLPDGDGSTAAGDGPGREKD